VVVVSREPSFQYVVKDAGGFSPIGFGVSSDTIVFGGAVDGTLIVKQGHQDWGIVFVAPSKLISATRNYRFPVTPGTATGLP
jgi:hypothetical protein